MKNIYVVHDRLTDTYRAYKQMTKMSVKEHIPVDTLRNNFSRQKLNVMITKDAKVITKIKLI